MPDRWTRLRQGLAHALVTALLVALSAAVFWLAGCEMWRDAVDAYNPYHLGDRR